jgi:adenosylhomocysteine nucleosidase
MPSELRPLVRPLALRRQGSGGRDLHRGGIGRVEVVATRTGIGPAAGRRAAERVLDATAVDHLVVVGIAGGIGASVAIGDLVVPEQVVDLATGTRHHPCPLGPIPLRGVLVTSDGLLSDLEAIRRLGGRGVVAVDMESAAIVAVCEARGIPCSVFRGISDRADDGSVDEAIFGLTRPDGSANLAAVARLLLSRPQRMPQLVRLARGMHLATRVAASAAVSAIAAM